jgi:hypothetical protein
MANTDDPKDNGTPGGTDPILILEDRIVPPAAEPEKTIVQRRNGVHALIGGAVAAVFGFGLAQVVPDGWPIQSTDAITAEVAALKDEIATLQGRLAEIPPPDFTLPDRVAALESQPATDLTPLADRITALEAQPAPTPTDAGGGINVATSVLAAQAKDIAALQADVAALQAGGAISPDIEARLAEAEARAASIAAQTEADAIAARQRNALDRLDIAMESGAPFATALADLGDAPIPAVLSDNAASGLPAPSTLRSSFPEAARAALEASLRASMGESWTDRAASFLRSQTGARSLTPREGGDPDAVLSRAEAAVAEGRVTDAITEIAALPAEGQAALATWLEQANLYLTAQQAVADLRTALKVE